VLRARLGESLRRRQSGRFSVTTPKEELRVRMETKEIAMSKRTKLLGTAGVLATALAAGPAAADTLAGFNGFAATQYAHSSFTSCNGCAARNDANLGLGMALPLADLPNLNWQIDAKYSHDWWTRNNNNHSQEVWDFGLSPFWAGPQSRFGLNLAYETITHFGHQTNGGAFMEWYLSDAVTLSAKGGYISDGGTPNGGNGEYFGGQALFYAMPDLAVSGHIAYQDQITAALQFPTVNGALLPCVAGLSCPSQGKHNTSFGIHGEFLPDENLGVALNAGFTYIEFGGIQSFKDTRFDIGLKYYTGTAGGSLENRHRNGSLRDWLRGP